MDTHTRLREVIEDPAVEHMEKLLEKWDEFEKLWPNPGPLARGMLRAAHQLKDVQDGKRQSPLEAENENRGILD
jgi:hypothetical protein